MNNISITGEACVGCRSCEQTCPKKCIIMTENHEGFLYPIVQERECIGCGLCIKVCPCEQINVLGHIPFQTFALRNKDEQSLFRSASGGAATAAALSILKRHGIVYGASYDNELCVKHIKVSTSKDLEKLQSSKYVQSDTGNCYSEVKKFLLSGNTVLFSGTPCQIDGLYAFLGKKYENLYTIDLICHGVPSPKLLRNYFKYQEKRLGEKVCYYNFRSKEKRGWGTHYLLKSKSKSETKALSLDKYGKQFLSGNCYRECCYKCRYANTVRMGDITVGDFWGIYKNHPEIISTYGVSSVFLNTQKGKTLLNSIENTVFLKEVTLGEAMVKQCNLLRPTHRPRSRDNFYKNIDNDNFFENLRIGIQIISRVKSKIPNSLLLYLKRKLK